MTTEILNLMKTVLQQTEGLKKLTTQQKDAQILADATTLEMEALEIELSKNTDLLKNALNQ
jgi:hypothetical protein